MVVVVAHCFGTIHAIWGLCWYFWLASPIPDQLTARWFSPTKLLPTHDAIRGFRRVEIKFMRSMYDIYVRILYIYIDRHIFIVQLCICVYAVALSNSKKKDSVILWDHVWMQGLFKEPIQELEIEPDLEVGQPSRQAVPQMFRLWMLTLLWFPCFMALWCSHLPEFLQEPFKLWMWKWARRIVTRGEWRGCVVWWRFLRARKLYS